MTNRTSEQGLICKSCGETFDAVLGHKCRGLQPRPSNLWNIHVDLIRMAAQLVRGEGVPDWSEHTFYRSTPVGERRDMMQALRDADEALRSYGSRLKQIADKVSAEIRAPGPVQTEVCPVCRTVHDKPLCPAPDVSDDHG